LLGVQHTAASVLGVQQDDGAASITFDLEICVFRITGISEIVVFIFHCALFTIKDAACEN
jgi:hypothetical protein